MTVFKIMQI